MNKSLQVYSASSCCVDIVTNVIQEVNVQNMNVELVAQMFKNYQSNVLFHLEGKMSTARLLNIANQSRNGESEGPLMSFGGGDSIRGHW